MVEKDNREVNWSGDKAGFKSSNRITIKKVSSGEISDATDLLASEDPLEIRIEYGAAKARVQKKCFSYHAYTGQ
jgi:hypothetical protein